MKQLVVTQILRGKSSENHSIENLFCALKPHLSLNVTLRVCELRSTGAGLITILFNSLRAVLHSRGVKHITGDINYVGIILPRPILLTVHDCGHLRQLTGIKRLLYWLFWYKLPCLRADLITVVSEETKQQLVSEVANISHKIRVVNNCLSIDIPRTVRPFCPISPKILQIGSGPHKNLRTLVQAVRDIDCELHIVGKISDSDLQLLRATNVRFQNEIGVSNARIVELYRNCDILFFASRHEGFGLPILEAQSAGIPVITSNLSPMREIAGRGAILVDPDSVFQIQDAIKLLMSDKCVRSRLLDSGFANLARFTPHQIANEYLVLYQELALSNRTNN